jgi:hypothetical protein
MPEGHGHGENLIGTSQIELEVKLLILRVFDLLARDSRTLAIVTISRDLQSLQAEVAMEAEIRPQRREVA